MLTYLGLKPAPTGHPLIRKYESRLFWFLRGCCIFCESLGLFHLSKNTEKSATGFTKKWIQSTPIFGTSATELLRGRTGGFKAFLYRSRRSSAALTPARPYEKSVFALFRNTTIEWIEDKCPQLGASLAYFTIFSLAPLVLVLLAVFGMVFGSSEHAREKITEQLQYFIDPSGIKVIKDIAANAAKPTSSILATSLGIFVALFGASGVFGQLQEALNTIWGVKLKPGAGLWGFVRARFLSFAMVAGICFLLLVSLTVETALRALNSYLKSILPGGDIVALVIFLLFDLIVIVLLFAMIFRYLPDARIRWRDVWVGATLTAVLFIIGKFLLGFYLGSGAAGSAYGAASSLITLLLWIYYAAQIVLFGAEFTQVYTNTYGSYVEPEEHAVRVEKREIEVPVSRS